MFPFLCCCDCFDSSFTGTFTSSFQREVISIQSTKILIYDVHFHAHNIVLNVGSNTFSLPDQFGIYRVDYSATPWGAPSGNLTWLSDFTSLKNFNDSFDSLHPTSNFSLIGNLLSFKCVNEGYSSVIGSPAFDLNCLGLPHA